MAQGDSPVNTGLLDKILARFQAKKTGNTHVEEPKEILDPADPSKKIPNPNYKGTSDGNNQQPMSVTALYEGLFNAPVKDPKKAAPTFSLPADAIAKAAGKMDFAGNLPPELQEQLSGDQPISKETMLALVNHVGRTAYARAIEHGTALTGNFVEARVSHESQGLPDAVRTYLAKNKSVGKAGNPADPSVREHVNYVSERIAQLHPDASDDDIAELTTSYFTEMARAINPGAFTSNEVKDPNANAKGDVQDYDSYLSGTKTLDQATQPVPAQKAA